MGGLTGNPRKIVSAFFKDMQARGGGNETQEMSLEKISIIAGINKKSLKNTLHRLIKNGVLIRTEYKDGRGGWSKYALNEKIFNELQHKYGEPV